jgi:hypothetical protein
MLLRMLLLPTKSVARGGADVSDSGAAGRTDRERSALVRLNAPAAEVEAPSSRTGCSRRQLPRCAIGGQPWRPQLWLCFGEAWHSWGHGSD